MGIKKIGLLCLMLLLVMITLTGCFTKESITADDFKTRMEELGYVVNDVSSQNNMSYIKSIYLAVDSDEKYQIEFYELKSEDWAEYLFDQNVEDVENAKGSGSTYVSISGQNYCRYTQGGNGEYWVLSYIDNTFVFVHVSDEFKEDVKGALEAIGY